MTHQNHPLFARFYSWVSPKMERAGGAQHRRQLLAGLSGRVLEVGAGNGLNFPYYPSEVVSVVAVEPEPHLYEIARRTGRNASVQVEVVRGVAENLSADDGTFDAAVVSLVLCSVADQEAALREIRRVLTPGGQLRFFEHVRADRSGLERVQRLLDATVWPRVAGGCHAGRDTLGAIEKAGFSLDQVDKVRFPSGPITTPTSSHVLGIASRVEVCPIS